MDRPGPIRHGRPPSWPFRTVPSEGARRGSGPPCLLLEQHPRAGLPGKQPGAGIAPEIAQSIGLGPLPRRRWHERPLPDQRMVDNPVQRLVRDRQASVSGFPRLSAISEGLSPGRPQATCGTGAPAVGSTAARTSRRGASAITAVQPWARCYNDARCASASFATFMYVNHPCRLLSGNHRRGPRPRCAACNPSNPGRNPGRHRHLVLASCGSRAGMLK